MTKVTRKVSSVGSAQLGKLAFTTKDGVASFDVRLPNADVILLKIRTE